LRILIPRLIVPRPEKRFTKYSGNLSADSVGQRVCCVDASPASTTLK
jgi:hypothetical protein